MINGNLFPHSGKILAIDLGEKRIGIAISDETQILARPLRVINHISLIENVKRVVLEAESECVSGIVVGAAMDQDGNLNFSGNRSAHFAKKLQASLKIPVILWNEDFSTKDAKHKMIEAGVPKMKRRGHIDAHAAACILQSFLDSEREIK